MTMATYEQSQVDNLQACGVPVPDDLRRQAALAEFFRGWSRYMSEAVYHTQALGEEDQRTAAELGLTADDVLGAIASWADRVGKKTLESTSGSFADHVREWLALHDPACTDDELRAKLRAAL